MFTNKLQTSFVAFTFPQFSLSSQHLKRGRVPLWLNHFLHSLNYLRTCGQTIMPAVVMKQLCSFDLPMNVPLCKTNGLRYIYLNAPLEGAWLCCIHAPEVPTPFSTLATATTTPTRKGYWAWATQQIYLPVCMSASLPPPQPKQIQLHSIRNILKPTASQPLMLLCGSHQKSSELTDKLYKIRYHESRPGPDSQWESLTG